MVMLSSDVGFEWGLNGGREVTNRDMTVTPCQVGSSQSVRSNRELQNNS